MKILFFDMEFANGKIPGSVFSFGYVQTNRKFKLTEPQTDLLMNPECNWNDYVRQHILAYPMTLVKEASTFPKYYKRLKKLLCRADLAVGFAVSNDTTALRKACERYALKPLVFDAFDTERLCKLLPDHREARGLAGCVEAWCRVIPKNQHRSDGDAYATMLLLQTICEQKGLDVRKLKKLYPQCVIPSLPPEQPEKEEKQGKQDESAQTSANGQMSHTKRRRRRPARPAAGATVNAEKTANNASQGANRTTGSRVQNAPQRTVAAPTGDKPVGTARKRRRRKPRTPNVTLPKSSMPKAQTSANVSLNGNPSENAE